MPAVIIACPKCHEHEFQDTRYGRKMRVYNLKKKEVKSSIVKGTCTICGAETIIPINS